MYVWLSSFSLFRLYLYCPYHPYLTSWKDMLRQTVFFQRARLIGAASILPFDEKKRKPPQPKSGRRRAWIPDFTGRARTGLRAGDGKRRKQPIN
jgi:hypothetical protein